MKHSERQVDGKGSVVTQGTAAPFAGFEGLLYSYSSFVLCFQDLPRVLLLHQLAKQEGAWTILPLLPQ